jgi:hypothetical protein
MILVTGMSRSGTSMVCQLLTGLGVAFGDSAAMLPGDRWNPSGYFELREVVDVNSLVITGLPRTRSRFGAWCSKVAYLCMPPAAAIAGRAARQRTAIAALGERHRARAVKDPRFCLSLLYWRQWAAVDLIVVCVRHPAAVVDSLLRRHWLPRWLGARFYAYHIDALLAQLPETGVAFVDVDRLVAGDARELDALRGELGLAAGVPSAELMRAVVRSELFTSGERVAGPCPAVALAAWQRLTAVAAARRSQVAGEAPV